MKKTITYCDRCEDIIKVGARKGSFKMNGHATKNAIEVTTLDYKELCGKCTLKLFFLIDKLMTKEKNLIMKD
jgi:hypothetical protein